MKKVATTTGAARERKTCSLDRGCSMRQIPAGDGIPNGMEGPSSSVDVRAPPPWENGYRPPARHPQRNDDDGRRAPPSHPSLGIKRECFIQESKMATTPEGSRCYLVGKGRNPARPTEVIREAAHSQRAFVMNSMKARLQSEMG